MDLYISLKFESVSFPIGMCGTCALYAFSPGAIVHCSSRFDYQGVHVPWVYVYSAISEMYVVWSGFVALGLISRGVCLPWVYVHSSLSDTYAV